MFRIWIIVILFRASLNSDQYFKYCQRSAKLKSIIRGNYKNVLSYEASPLLISPKQYQFADVLGVPFRNEVYASGSGYQGINFLIGYSMIIELRQMFELNTLVLMLRYGDVRTYDFIVYASDSNQETVIYDSITYYSQVVQIKFPNQYVKYFRIYNRNGNSDNNFINIVKAEAYFSIR